MKRAFYQQRTPSRMPPMTMTQFISQIFTKLGGNNNNNGAPAASNSRNAAGASCKMSLHSKSHYDAADSASTSAYASPASDGKSRSTSLDPNNLWFDYLINYLISKLIILILRKLQLDDNPKALQWPEHEARYFQRARHATQNYVRLHYRNTQ